MPKKIAELTAITAADITDDSVIRFGVDSTTLNASRQISLAELKNASAVRVFATVAAMSSATGVKDGDVAITRGYTTAGVGAGAYRFVSGDSTTADAGFVIAHTAGRWHLVDKSSYDPTKFGAIGDGVADDTSAFQACLNATKTYGALVEIPPGRYLLGSSVSIPPRFYLTIRGVSNGPYTDANNPLTDATSGVVIYCPNASSGFLITRNATTAHRGLLFDNFSMRGVSAFTPVAAFRLNTNGLTTFCRQFTWRNVGATYFQYVVLIEDTGASSDKAWGVFRFQGCNMQNNKGIVFCNNSTRINNFAALDNEFGANLDATLTYRQGAIDITGSNIVIERNVLEGCNNPIRLNTPDAGVSIKDNHFEAVTGDWIAYIRHPSATCRVDIDRNLMPTTLGTTLTKGYWVQGNNSGSDAGCRGGIHINEMWTPQSVFCTPDQVDRISWNNNFGSTSTDEIHIVTLPDKRWHHRPTMDELYITQAYPDTCQSPYGEYDRVRSYTTLNTASFRDVFGQISSFAAGDWIFCSYLLRRRDFNTTNPNTKVNFALYYSASPTTGPRPFLYGTGRATSPGLYMENRWVMIIHGWRATGNSNAGNNVRAQIIPYDQVNGNFDLTGFCFYKCSSPNEFRPFIPWDYISGGEYSLGNKTGSTAVDWTAFPSQSLTLTGNVDFLAGGWTVPSRPSEVSLRIRQNATGGFTVTWPSSITWQGGAAKQPRASANSTSIFKFYYDGSSYYETATNNA